MHVGKNHDASDMHSNRDWGEALEYRTGWRSQSPKANVWRVTPAPRRRKLRQGLSLKAPLVSPSGLGWLGSTSPRRRQATLKGTYAKKTLSNLSVSIGNIRFEGRFASAASSGYSIAVTSEHGLPRAR
jgi:hypothetical protein